MEGAAAHRRSKIWKRLTALPAVLRRRLREAPLRVGSSLKKLPLPPGRLMYQIGGTRDVDWFIDSGRMASEDILSILAGHGKSADRLGAMLDFGCGAGRVLRHWTPLAQRGVALHGTDYNPAMISWCSRRLGFASFRINGLDGRLDYPDATFDVAYALSVFTHLDEARQENWMVELWRVLKPGGLLIITLHGDAYRPMLPSEDAARFDRGELVVSGAKGEGSNDCAAFHPPSYVWSRFAAGWDVLEHRPSGARGNPIQDYYVLRRPLLSGSTKLAG
jgi:SAM-dependent methyltransferase